jgi:hypothetical protein
MKMASRMKAGAISSDWIKTRPGGRLEHFTADPARYLIALRTLTVADALHGPKILDQLW